MNKRFNNSKHAHISVIINKDLKKKRILIKNAFDVLEHNANRKCSI